MTKKEVVLGSGRGRGQQSLVDKTKTRKRDKELKKAESVRVKGRMKLITIVYIQ